MSNDAEFVGAGKAVCARRRVASRKGEDRMSEVTNTRGETAAMLRISRRVAPAKAGPAGVSRRYARTETACGPGLPKAKGVGRRQ